MWEFCSRLERNQVKQRPIISIAKLKREGKVVWNRLYKQNISHSPQVLLRFTIENSVVTTGPQNRRELNIVTNLKTLIKQSFTRVGRGGGEVIECGEELAVRTYSPD